MTDQDDNDDEKRDRLRVNIGAGLSTLADLLDSLGGDDRIERRGRDDEGDRSVEYSYSIGTGLDPSAASPGNRPPPRRRERREERSDDRRSDRKRRSRRSSDDDHATSVRETEEGMVLVADLDGVSADDLTVGIDDSREEVVVAADSDAIERVPIDIEAFEVADATFNNGVLEIRFEEGADERE